MVDYHTLVFSRNHVTLRKEGCVVWATKTAKSLKRLGEPYPVYNEFGVRVGYVAKNGYDLFMKNDITLNITPQQG